MIMHPLSKAHSEAEAADAAWLADFAQQETERYVVECPPPGTIPPPHHAGCSMLCQLFEECSTPVSELTAPK